MKQQLIKGNISVDTQCSECKMICGSIYALEGLKCIWCQRHFHEKCLLDGSLDCDFGPLKNNIVLPENVIVTQNQAKKKTIVSLKFPQKDGVIVVVVINKTSGGQQGIGLLNDFYRILNPIQVINLVDEGLEKLHLFSKCKKLRVIVGGGDGTISSVTSYLKDSIPEFKERNPPVAPFALGTGNDLSNALGWGGSSPEYEPEDLIRFVTQESVLVLLDRFRMVSRSMGKKEQETTSCYMYNYFGAGLDAHIAHEFQKMRSKFPQLFTSQFGNKFIYGQMGTFYLFNGQKYVMKELIQIECDGRIIDVPECQNLVVQNITYWGGGAYDAWDNEGLGEAFQLLRQKMNDNKVEVFAVNNLLHLGQIQINIAKPKRVCQGHHIKLTCRTNGFKMPVHVDGEPRIIEGPFEVEFSFQDQVYMMAGQKEEKLFQWGKVFQTLEWAESEGHITNAQKEIIINKFNQN